MHRTFSFVFQREPVMRRENSTRLFVPLSFSLYIWMFHVTSRVSSTVCSVLWSFSRWRSFLCFSSSFCFSAMASITARPPFLKTNQTTVALWESLLSYLFSMDVPAHLSGNTQLHLHHGAQTQTWTAPLDTSSLVRPQCSFNPREKLDFGF